MARLRLDLLRPILLAVAFVIGVVVFAAASAIGQPPAPAPPAGSGLVRAAPVAGPVMVVTTSQAFGY